MLWEERFGYGKNTGSSVLFTWFDGRDFHGLRKYVSKFLGLIKFQDPLNTVYIGTMLQEADFGFIIRVRY